MGQGPCVCVFGAHPSLLGSKCVCVCVCDLPRHCIRGYWKQEGYTVAQLIEGGKAAIHLRRLQGTRAGTQHAYNRIYRRHYLR